MGDIKDLYEITGDMLKKIKKFREDKSISREALGFVECYGVHWKITLKRNGEDFDVEVSLPRCPYCRTELQEVHEGSGYDQFFLGYDCPNPECGRIKELNLNFNIEDCQERIRKTEYRKIEQKLEEEPIKN